MEFNVPESPTDKVEMVVAVRIDQPAKEVGTVKVVGNEAAAKGAPVGFRSSLATLSAIKGTTEISELRLVLY